LLGKITILEGFLFGDVERGLELAWIKISSKFILSFLIGKILYRLLKDGYKTNKPSSNSSAKTQKNEKLQWSQMPFNSLSLRKYHSKQRDPLINISQVES
jgi:hypothetical protein